MKANPSYWGGKPAVDEVVFRLFNNADAMVAALEEGRDRRRPRRPERSRSTACERPTGSSPSRASRAASTRSRSTAAPEQRSKESATAPGALDRRGPQGDRARDRQEGAARPRLRSASARPATTVSPSAEPRVDPRDPRRTSSSTSTSRRRRRSSTTPATRTRTATASARCRAAARPLDLTLLRALRVRDRAARSPSSSRGWLKEIGIETTLKAVERSTS